MTTAGVLDRLSPAVREWFGTTFVAPTAAQSEGFAQILERRHTLISAPTGSGKTLAAFLVAIDRMMTEPLPADDRRTRVLYVSPLRALAFDVEKNLRAPLLGSRLAAERLGVTVHEPTVGLRTGDTPSRERQRLIRNPPDILITTPESLYLMLTSSARATLANVDTIIIDEIHALAAGKRGAHLMLSLERLERVTATPPQRIGLSATQRPLEEVARFLGGCGESGPRPVSIVDAGARKTLDVEVVVPVDDMAAIGTATNELRSGPATAALVPRRVSIWPSVYPRLLELINEHTSTIIFCNARRQAERLAAQLNELAGLEHELVRAHHGSLAREQRILIEDRLKRGELKAIVATSSLELGIDMGAVDLVIQVESPGSVSRGLQRIGRAGHAVGAASRGKVFPKHRHDLVETAVVVRAMLDARIEATRYLRNPLDVLAQQIVAEVAVNPGIAVGDVATMVRRCANFAELSDELFAAVLDLLAGRYPSEEFSELRPRIVWDRVANTLRARDGAQRLAVTNGGTIPDRGLFGVFLPDGVRVGELDEEMVYESRVGETFVLGASTWRIEDVSFDRVIVTPAPGQPGKMPFWHGDQLGRSVELAGAMGEFLRDVRDRMVRDGDATVAHLRAHHGLDDLAARNLIDYVGEQAESTGVVPDDATIVVERFRDEIGDWRVCIHSPYGTAVHAPWALAIERRLEERLGMTVETMWSDDGIVLRLPEAVDNVPVDELFPDPDDVAGRIIDAVPSTALFAARFRECAARALLLPRRRPNQRTPLWQQRQRAADLLAVAAKYPTFPILLETSRECLQDVFNLPALRDVLTRIRSRSIRTVAVDTPKASPFAQNLLFSWIAAYMYEGDAPLAERRAAALALDRDLLDDLLGAEELRELLSADAIATVEAELQCVAGVKRARTADELHDVLRRIGDASTTELALRCTDDVAPLVAELRASRRAIEVVVGGESRWITAEDAGRYRDAFGCALPLGLPQAFTDPVPRALVELVARFARTHGPFTTADVAQRWAVPLERLADALNELESSGRVVRGEFRPQGTDREWCDVDVLRMVRRRSLAILRKEIEPVDRSVFTRFTVEWHGIDDDRSGTDALVDAIGRLQGASLVASGLDDDVLAARVRGYRPSMLDELCTSGELMWVGAGSIGARDGRIRLVWADQAPLVLAAYEPPEAPGGEVHAALRAALHGHGASFWGALRARVTGYTDSEVLAALWDLVWAGEVTNDSLAPVRAMLAGGPGASRRGGPASSGAYRRAARRTSAYVMRPRRAASLTARSGPPTASGRWSLVADALGGDPSTGDVMHTDVMHTEVMHAAAAQLLERHGIVTREAVLAEGLKGGFAGVYAVLRRLEERGEVRRGYFVDGLGAAQFAVPGAVDRLRATDVRDRVVALAATDPAQPFGAAVDWPESTGRAQRQAGALVVIANGEALIWCDVRGGHLVTFPRALEDTTWIDALCDLPKQGRVGRLTIRRINSTPLDTASRPADVVPIVDALLARGFVDGYRGVSLRD
jgi:ATP-dependent Lhr-like helicase